MRTILLLACSLCVLATRGQTQAFITEVSAPSAGISTTYIDLDAAGPAGATTVAAINAAGLPTPAAISNITLTPSGVVAGVYNTNPACQRALALTLANPLELIDAPAGAFEAANAQIDLGGPSTVFGVGIGDWVGPMILDFYLGGLPQATFTSTTYATCDIKIFEMTNGTFDRVDISAQAGANWVITEFEIQLVDGLFANFSANQTAGAQPLVVQFTDQSFTSDPGGILTWEWDFNNDGTIDSFVQNPPPYTYNGCGDFSVSLRVTDATNPASTETKTNYIQAEALTADFLSNACVSGALTVQFSDLSLYNPTSWAWDFDGDGIVDSNNPNDSFTYPASGQYSVTLTVGNACRSDSITRTIDTFGNKLTTLFANNNSGGVGGGVYFDVVVSRRVRIDAFETNFTAVLGAAVGLDVWTTPNTYVGNEANPGAWTQVGTGTGTAAGLGLPTFIPMAASIDLLPGNYGLALVAVGSGHAYTNGTGPNQNYSDGFMALSLGSATNVAFTGAPFTPRVWNGSFVYCPGCRGNVVTSGTGCTRAGTELTMDYSGCPDIGAQFGIEMATAPSVTDLIFFIAGISNTSWMGIALPLDLQGIVGPGCFVWSSHDVTIGPVPNPGGGAGIQATLPMDPTIVGGTLYWQGYMPFISGNPLNFVFSDSLAMTIG